MSYLASVFGLSAARQPEPPPALDAHLPAGVLQGLRRILVNPILRALTMHAAIYNLAAQILTVNLVVWLVKDRHLSSRGYGLALSAAGRRRVLRHHDRAAAGQPARLRHGRSRPRWCSPPALPLLLAALPFHG